MPEFGQEPEWSPLIVTGNSRRNLISGLRRGEEYQVQVRAVNRHGASDWSPAVRQLAH